MAKQREAREKPKCVRGDEEANSTQLTLTFAHPFDG